MLAFRVLSRLRCGRRRSLYDLVPAAFFLSTARKNVQKPNALIYLAYVGFVTLTAGLVLLSIGLLDAEGTASWRAVP